MKYLSCLVRFAGLFLWQYLTGGPVLATSTASGTCAVAGGRSHSLALQEDGSLWAWGYNDSDGILGDGSAERRRLPAIVFPRSISRMATGFYHSLALQSNGTVWAWGANFSGQLGRPAGSVALVPAPLTGLSHVSAIVAGAAHSLAIAEGRVWSWGNNEAGQLGHGNTDSTSSPVLLDRLADVRAVAAGAEFSIALADDRVWAWGYNSEDGELGNGTVKSSPVPVPVAGLRGVEVIAAGAFHALAVSNGYVFAWGYNADGQLGRGNLEPTLWPVPVQLLSNVVQVSAGSYHSLALTKDGVVWAWGANERGQLGDRANESRVFPVALKTLPEVSSIGAGDYHSLAVGRNGTVWTWGANDDNQLGDDTSLDSNVPVPVEGLLIASPGHSNPLARAGIFQRGDGLFAADWSTVISLDFQKGVKLDRLGRQSEALFGSDMWGSDWHYHFNGAAPESPLPFQGPLAAFGQRAGGSRLNLQQSYSFGAYAGERSDTPGTDVMVVIYHRHTLQPIATNHIHVPDSRRAVEWAHFLAQGSTITSEIPGLHTVLTLVPGSDLSWVPGNSGVLQLRHRASDEATAYLYLLAVRGEVTSAPMVTSRDAPAWSPLYTLEFDPRPAWQPVFADQPHFEKDPHPHHYEGTAALELLSSSAAVTNAVTISPRECLDLDNSPELRCHPVLDQFIEDQRHNPIALASYVQNEIQLTDGMAYHDHGGVYDQGIYAGGVNRGALGTFLEGQGSPTEQCALLVYLLRRCGVPAAYIFPSRGGLLLRSRSLSKLLRMQFQGLIDNQGVSDIPEFVPVNYPWVAAHTGGQWVHLFPWLKDTEIIEGLNLYDYLPDRYNSGTQWLSRFVEGDTNILALSSRGNTPSLLFPLFIQQTLRRNFPGLALEDLGMQVRHRRQHHSSWEDFPRPHAVLDLIHPTKNLSSPALALVDPGLTNLFDTVSIEVFSVRNPSRRLATGDLRMADLHNRRFIVWHEKIPRSDPVRHRMILSLAPYRPTNSGSAAFTNDASLLRPQNVTNILSANDDELQLQIIHRRQRALPASFKTRPPFQWDLFGGFSSVQEIVESRPLRKGDLAAICLNPGRVTKRMKQVHAEEFWRMQREEREQPSRDIAPDLHQGLPAYLLGLSYFERVSRFNEWNERLHKVRSLSWFAAGLARLSPHRVNGQLPHGEITLTWPSLDMFLTRVAVAGNGTYRPDSGRDPILAGRDYARLLTAEGSAQEHQTIEDYFGQTNALSTVKLLQLAAQSRRSGRSDGILILDRNNYRVAGDVKYHGRALKLHDPSVWREVTNALAATTLVGSPSVPVNDVQVFITPGTNSFNQGAYCGMGALILSDAGDSALISGNLHGAYGEKLIDSAFHRAAVANFHLAVSETGDLRVEFLEPTVPEPDLAPVLYEAPRAREIVHDAEDGGYYETPVDSDAAQQMEQILRLPANTPTATRVAVSESRGFLGQTWDALRAVGSIIADPVHASSGAFYLDEVDLHLSGPMPLQMRRNYSSHNLAHNQLGFGWKLNHMPFLSLSADGELIYAAEPDGAVIGYQRDAVSESWAPSLTLNPQLTHHSSLGVGSTANPFRSRIGRTMEEGQEVYRWSGADGSLRTFVMLTFSNSINATRPYLTRWQDGQGNYYTFVYGTNRAASSYGQVSRIESSNGGFLGFYYDPYGQIVEAYTGDGRRVLYDYDRFGDLSKVTRPDDSVLTFEYEHQTVTWTNGNRIVTAPYSTHLLAKELKADGRQLINHYDRQRRVVTQWSTVGPDLTPVRNATFSYSNNFTLETAATNAPTGFTVVRDAAGGESRFDYVDGLMIRLTDSLGQKVIQDWFTSVDQAQPGYYPRSLKRSIDKRGLETTCFYDPRGNLTNATLRGDLTGGGNPNEAATTTFTYNDQDLLIESCDPLGNLTRYVYDAEQPFLPAAIITSAGSATVSFTLKSYHCITNVNALGDTTSFACGLLRQEVRGYGSPDASTNEWRHDARGFVVEEVRPTGTADPAVTNRFRYNDRGELITIVDGAGRSHHFRYDDRGRQIAALAFEAGATTPVAWEFSYYNQNGDLVWSDGPRFDPEDYVWRDHDGAGRLIEEVRWRTCAKPDGSGVQTPSADAAFSSSSRHYDPFGNLVRSIDPRGSVTLAQYDLLGRTIAEIFCDAAGQPLATNQYAYEPGGQVVRRRNPLGGEVVCEYTSNGRVKYERNATGASRAWRYQLDGRTQLEMLSNGSFWETTYADAARRVVRVFRDATNVFATFVTEFDRRGNLIRTVDPAGFATTNLYDRLDRLSRTMGPVIETPGQRPVQQTAFYAYGLGHTLRTVSNQLGETIATVNDVLGRPRQIVVRGPDQTTARSTRFEYSRNHHAQTRWEGSGSNEVCQVTFSDPAHRPLLELVSSAPVSGSSVHTTYDAAGNRTDQWQTSWNGYDRRAGASNHWEYDSRNRIVSQRSRGGGPTVYRYDAAGNLTHRSMPGGLTWSADYTPGSALRSEENQATGITARVTHYDYFPPSHPWAGLLRQRVSGDGQIFQTRSYDAALRVQAIATYGPNLGPDLIRSFVYDARGLMTRLTEASPDGQSSVEVERSYDGYGELIREEISVDGQRTTRLTQSWDAAGRRRGLAFEGASPSFVYDYRPDDLMSSARLGPLRFDYFYADNGLLLRRYSPPFERRVEARDGQGRVLSQAILSAGQPILTETLRWTGTGRLASYEGIRPTARFASQYYYSDEGRLTGEVIEQNGQRAVLDYAFDYGAGAGPGTLTAVRQLGASSAAWQASPAFGLDSLHRLRREETTFKERSATGHAFGADHISATLNGRPLPIGFDPDATDGAWTTLLRLEPGPQALQVSASRTSDGLTATATNHFVVSPRPDTIENTYDTRGHVVERTWNMGTGQFLRRQTLVWDGYDRLIQVREMDAGHRGYEWTARYDALGRRVRTTHLAMTNSVQGLGAIGRRSIIETYHDPTVPFLEVGWNIDGQRFWCLYGPDLSGRFGGLHGLGGLEGIVAENNEALRFLTDAFGNAVGSADVKSSHPTLWTTAPGNYGPDPSSWLRLTSSGKFGSIDAQAERFTWRGRRLDPTGLYHLGHRYYDPVARRFLSPDPLGHTGSTDLYAFAHGDPVNFFDPDGQVGKAALSAVGIAATGLINTSVAVVTLPLAAAERAVFHGFTGAPVMSYLQDYLKNALGSFAAFATLTRNADYIPLLLALGHQIPFLGNFVPGPRGNMNGPPVIFISGGISANTEAADQARDTQQAENMRAHGVSQPVLFAPHVRGTATEVLAALFGGYTARGLEHALQVSSQVEPGSTVFLSAHSGGVIRSGISSFYLGFQNIGVARSFAEQGPALGFYSNIAELRGNYSLGRDVVSNFGAILSLLYWGNDTAHVWSFSNDPHRQGGHPRGGNEFNLPRSEFFRRPTQTP